MAASRSKALNISLLACICGLAFTSVVVNAEDRFPCACRDEQHWSRVFSGVTVPRNARLLVLAADSGTVRMRTRAGNEVEIDVELAGAGFAWVKGRDLLKAGEQYSIESVSASGQPNRIDLKVEDEIDLIPPVLSDVTIHPSENTLLCDTEQTALITITTGSKGTSSRPTIHQVDISSEADMQRVFIVGGSEGSGFGSAAIASISPGAEDRCVFASAIVRQNPCAIAKARVKWFDLAGNAADWGWDIRFKFGPIIKGACPMERPDAGEHDESWGAAPAAPREGGCNVVAAGSGAGSSAWMLLAAAVRSGLRRNAVNDQISQLLLHRGRASDQATGISGHDRIPST